MLLLIYLVFQKRNEEAVEATGDAAAISEEALALALEALEALQEETEEETLEETTMSEEETAEVVTRK